MSNEFVDYFLEKIQMIRIELDQHPKYQPDRCDVPKFTEFHPMSNKEILKIMNEMLTKYCELDAIQQQFLKKTYTLYQRNYYQNSKCITN